MRIQLPPVDSPRRPIAYKLSGDYLYFLFDARKEVFLLKDSDASLFWHKHCRDCRLLHLGQCSGGSPNPFSLVQDSSLNHRGCYQDFSPSVEPRPVIVDLVPHVFRFRVQSSLRDPYIFFMGQEENLVMLYPYILGNVYYYGLLCTTAIPRTDLNQFLETLFASLWNADLSSNWFDFAGVSDYSVEAHIAWLKNINYERMMADCDHRNRLSISMDTVHTLTDETYVLI